VKWRLFLAACGPRSEVVGFHIEGWDRPHVTLWHAYAVSLGGQGQGIQGAILFIARVADSHRVAEEVRSSAVLLGCSVRGTWHKFFLSFCPAHLILFHFLLGRSILIQHMFSYQFVSYSVLDFLPRRWYGICMPHFTIILFLLID